MLNLPTSIPTLSQHQPEGVTFRMKDGRLFIEGAEDGIPIRIYTTDGQLVASAPLAGAASVCPSAVLQVYMPYKWEPWVLH